MNQSQAVSSDGIRTISEFSRRFHDGLLGGLNQVQCKNTDYLQFGLNRFQIAGVWLRDRMAALFCKMGLTPRHAADEKASRALTFITANEKAFAQFYDLLGDAESKALLVELLKFRVLGNLRVKLPSNNEVYWKAYTSIDRKYLEKRKTHETPRWTLNQYRLGQNGDSVRLHGGSLTVLNSFVLEQYAYQKGRTRIQVAPGDVVIYGGGGWGDTALYFADKVGPEGRVLSFEFVEDNLDVFRKNLGLNPRIAGRIESVPQALWDCSGESLEFDSRGPSTALRTRGGGEQHVSTVSIDDYVDQKGLQSVDWIKMDIEGSELRALRGAEDTLRRFRPTLAISLYHKLEDPVTIPRFLNDLDLGYEFFIDHFTIHLWETVLFARPREKWVSDS